MGPTQCVPLISTLLIGTTPVGAHPSAHRIPRTQEPFSPQECASSRLVFCWHFGDCAWALLVCALFGCTPPSPLPRSHCLLCSSAVWMSVFQANIGPCVPADVLAYLPPEMQPLMRKPNALVDPITREQLRKVFEEYGDKGIAGPRPCTSARTSSSETGSERARRGDRMRLL